MYRRKNIVHTESNPIATIILELATLPTLSWELPVLIDNGQCTHVHTELTRQQASQSSQT